MNRSDQHSHFFFFLSSLLCEAAPRDTLFEDALLGGRTWGAWAFWAVLEGADSYLDFLPPAITQAISLKNYLILWPVLAETSMYVSPSSLILDEARDCSTALSPSRSLLFPTIMMRASSPLTSLTLSIHLLRLPKELASEWGRMYWWCQRRWLLRWSPWCKKEWGSGSAPVRLCPRAAFGDSCSRRWRFWRRSRLRRWAG